VRSFTPRPFQPLMWNHIVEYHRSMLLVPMGMGKTSSVLMAISILLVSGSARKVLVLAPLRVAQSTWPDEAKKWAEFSHLRVSAIIGAPAERLAALRVKADIYTMNYDNLVWLIETVGDKWFWDMVVSDESTRVKNFRTKQGGKRAQALSKVAHKHVKRWVGLTGTVVPNGIKDLWGQMWFIDQGARLGSTYTAFMNRWFGFRNAKDAANHAGKAYVERIPFPHAQKEIEVLVKDVCLTLDVKDWFDVKEPVVNTLYVDLPPKQRKHYQEMERELYTVLENNEIEAFGAAAKTIKCLAEDTQVLTCSGWKKIQHVTCTDKVWDGVEWVATLGSVCNGYKKVVEYCGVFMTPDHLVLTHSGWKQAQELLDADAGERHDRDGLRVPDGASQRGFVQQTEVSTSNVALPVRVRHGGGPHRRQSESDTPGPTEVLRVQTWRDDSRRDRFARHDVASGLAFVVGHEIEVRQPWRQGLAQLRSTWDIGVQKVAGFFQEFLGRHGADMDSRTHAGPKEKRRQLHEVELPMGDCGRANQQPKMHCAHQDTGRDHAADPSGEAVRRQTDHDQKTHGSRLACGRPTETTEVAVYDVVNAGPRNRFTVRGTENTTVIVHNCLQFANGAAYINGSNDEWVEMHDEKLQALESIIEEAAGASVLVAYHFKSDLARIQRRFPQARVLDKKPQTILDWNEGRIGLLLAHPASAGHGLNLQDGGNILVFFSHWWNLEERQQIVERIGPVRQLQAGHDRPVFIHQIVARDTVDEDVIARISTKQDVQDVLLQALKRRLEL
jgi:hypothetical protein